MSTAFITMIIEKKTKLHLFSFQIILGKSNDKILGHVA